MSRKFRRGIERCIPVKIHELLPALLICSSWKMTRSSPRQESKPEGRGRRLRMRGPGRRTGGVAPRLCYTAEHMTKLLDEAVAQIRTLSVDEQDRAAAMLIALMRGPDEPDC